jgi:hypothetical protein
MVGDEGKKKIIGETFTCNFEGNFATLAHSTIGTSHALASKSPTRSLEWIIDSSASRHVTGTYCEFTLYTHLTPPESIQIAAVTSRLVVGKGTVKCTDLVTLSMYCMLHHFQ